MNTYQLTPPFIPGGPCTSVLYLDGKQSIPFDPANTDYQNFKAAINDDSAQLETPDGTLMTPEEAKTYVATLP